MRVLAPAVLLSVLFATASAHAQSTPLLQLQGQPYSNGVMTLHLIGTPGQPTLLLFGFDPLDPPAQTTKGPFHIGTVFNAFSLGAIPSLGRIDMPVLVPPLDPVFAGIPIVLQALVPGALSNPATLPLDQPYYVPANATILTSPNPTEVGLFGDKATTGDFNGDGAIDIAVGAWWEDSGGVDRSGRVYVFWGPSMSSTTMLEPQTPKNLGGFGMGLAVADIDGDEIDDLIVGEGVGDPPPSQASGFLYVYRGGNRFVDTPHLVVTSAGVGSAYTLFGRAMVSADFNADGHPDIAVGAPTSKVQELATAGQIDMYWGPSFTTSTILTAPDLAASGFLGDRLAVGDVNGDGITDLIAGTPRKKLGGAIAMGRVYLFTGPTLSHFMTIDHPLPNGSNSRFGNAVVGEDLNDDGIADVIATDQRNHAFVFWSPGFDQYQLITRPPDPVTGTAISISFGYFATTGDVNGDGHRDVIVTEPFVQRVYAALGPFWSDFHLLFDAIPESGDEFGWGVHARDVDGDGIDELLVGNDLGNHAGVAGSGRLIVFTLNHIGG